MEALSRKDRVKWYTHDRFGMFIHWGLYALHARGEWDMTNRNISADEYEKRYFQQFNPVDYDPKKWAKAAKDAGMKYVVLTAKHHDGFCLFDSKYTDYKSVNSPIGRDLIREYVDAVREAGLKVGIYYSLLDWHHPDYPKYSDPIHPMRGNEKYRDEKVNFDNYLTYMHNQVREICTNYGQIDLLWFDFSYEGKACEDWKATELMTMVRELQPNVIIDNRLEGSGVSFGSIMDAEPKIYAGDFASPEQVLPPEGIVNKAGEPVPWEMCLTMNNNWGYNSSDHEFKPAWLLIRKLVECVSKNGNMILNVGPDALGNFPVESVEILNEFAAWMKHNGQSIYGCGKCFLPKPEWGRYTQNGNKIYAHVLERSIGPLALIGIRPDQIESMRLLETGELLELGNDWNTKAFEGDNAFVRFGPNPGASYKLINDTDTVIEITLKN